MATNFYTMGKLQERIQKALEVQGIYQKLNQFFQVQNHDGLQYRQIAPGFENLYFVYYKFGSIHFVFEKSGNELTIVFMADDSELQDNTSRVFLFDNEKRMFVINHLIEKKPLYCIYVLKEGQKYRFDRSKFAYAGKLMPPLLNKNEAEWQKVKHKDMAKLIDSLVM